MSEQDERLTPEKTSKIEAAKKQLYSKYAEIKKRPRSHMHPHKQTAPHEWEHDATTPEVKTFSAVKTGVPVFRKVFFISIIFFVVAAALAAASLFGGRNIVSTNAINMQILTKAFVDGGETFDVTIEISNENAAPLELADLIFEYPKSSVESGELVRLRRPLNTIRPGQTVLEDFEATLFGEEGDDRRLRAVLEYRVQGSNAIFVREVDTVVAVQSTPIQIVLDAPDNVVNNQTITLDYDIDSNSTNVTENMLMRVEYPSGFKFDSADPSPSLGNNVWILGDLEPGASRNIQISGVMKGQPGEDRAFRAFVGEQDPEDEKQIITAFNSVTHVVSLSRSFIGAEIAINGDTSERVAVESGQDARIDIDWSNTLPVRLTNVKVTASLSGSAYSGGGINPRGGFFDSINDEVVWDRDSKPELAIVEPGQGGTLSFEVLPRALVSGNDVIDQPEIIIDVNVAGIDPAGNVQSASGVSRRTAIVNSDLQLTQKTLFYSGPFANTGTHPPRAEEPTTFTIGWLVTNSANDVVNGKVTTTLPSFVEWLNVVSPNTENITYNSVKREITWNLGDIEAGTGFSSGAREVFFKVSVTPSTSQIGQTPLITGDVILSGDDTFTDVLLRNIRRKHTTSLLNDIQPGSGTIQQ